MGAWPDFAESCFSDQLAFVVVVGHPGGDASSTGLGALGPGCGLDDTFGGIEHVNFRLWSVCCKHKKEQNL